MQILSERTLGCSLPTTQGDKFLFTTLIFPKRTKAVLNGLPKPFHFYLFQADKAATLFGAPITDRDTLHQVHEWLSVEFHLASRHKKLVINSLVYKIICVWESTFQGMKWTMNKQSEIQLKTFSLSLFFIK